MDVLCTNSTATAQLTCYRKLCEGCCWPVWNLLHAEHTQLSQLNDSSAPAQQVPWNFPPSSLTVRALHSSLTASSSHPLLQKRLTTKICVLLPAHCLQQPPSYNELLLLASQICTQAVCRRVSSSKPLLYFLHGQETSLFLPVANPDKYVSIIMTS